MRPRRAHCGQNSSQISNSVANLQGEREGEGESEGEGEEVLNKPQTRYFQQET